MILDRLTYRKLFPTGAFSNEAIEISGSLSPNEDIMQCYKELFDTARALHFSQNKEYYEQLGTQVKDIEQVGGKEGQLLSFIEAINTTTTRKSLEIFKKLVDRENNPKLTEAYDNKLKTFEDGL